jgi:organic radical activating enzyme
MPTLEITTMIGCPLMCTFCPQDALRDASKGDEKYLSFENYKKILNKIPKHVRIDFSGMSEPWANPECTAMLRHTLENGYSIAIYTTLYGITTDEVDEVVNLIELYSNKITDLVVHIQDKNNNMKGLKFTEEWIAVMNSFIALKNKNLLKNFQFITMDEGGIPHEFLASLLPLLPKFHGYDRAGSLPLEQIDGQKISIRKDIKGRIKCSFTTYYDQNVLLPNGDVLLCCMDYAKKHVIGNLLELESYYDLFKSQELHNIRIENMEEGVSKCSICRSCERACSAN